MKHQNTYIPLRDESEPPTPKSVSRQKSAERRGPRLFDPAQGDPTDERSFFASLGHELSGLRDQENIKARHQRLMHTCRRVMALAAVQTGCAVVILSSQILQPAALRDSAAVLTSIVVAAAGGLGMYGVIRRDEADAEALARSIKRSVWPLHAFFLSQIWVLAAVASQWMRSQAVAARQATVFASQGRETPGNQSLVNLSFLTALAVVYASMFYTDLLSEQLQDELEQQDQHSLLHFAWLMHKKTLIGVQRFEDLIHAKFEELVLLGFLRPRWQPHK